MHAALGREFDSLISFFSLIGTDQHPYDIKGDTVSLVFHCIGNILDLNHHNH